MPTYRGHFNGVDTDDKTGDVTGFSLTEKNLVLNEDILTYVNVAACLL